MNKIITIIAQITVFSLMVSLGLNLSINQLDFFRHNRKLMLRSFLAVAVLAPLATFILVSILKPSPTISVALIIMAACPAPPLTTLKVIKSEGNISYSAILQLTLSTLEFLTIPITLNILLPLLPFDITNLQFNQIEILKQVAVAQLIPIGLGVFLREKYPSLADKIVNPISKIANFSFLGLVVLVLVLSFKAILGIGFYEIITIIIVSIAFLAIGHSLGGPEVKNRVTLALITLTHNVGLALLIASLNFPNAKAFGPLLSIAVISAIVGLIYTKKFSKNV